ncbi:MAG: hypothetical protein BWK76_14515 [Desulfobulbaceae bacterium A2]|nr:MAG: hypothetical protein BWK76_14515 [Desulfobulbaceae bacterium A2]
MREERCLTVCNARGVHCRVATCLKEIADAYPGTISLVTGDQEACCDSVLAVLGLGLERGVQVTVRAEGADVSKVLDAVSTLLAMEQDP